MNDRLTRRLLLITRFDWALASNQVHRNEVKFILEDLRQKDRDLQQHAMEEDETGSLRTINMKQQIINLRRK